MTHSLYIATTDPYSGKSLVSLARTYTSQADMEFDDHGKVIKKRTPGNDLGLADTVVVDRNGPAPDPQTLFGGDSEEAPKSRRRKAKARKPKRRKRKR